MNTANTDWWLVIPTWLLALFTGGLFYYTFRLFGANAKLVDSAERSAKAAEDALVKVERPYVYVFSAHHVQIFSVGLGNGIAGVKYTVANYGRTPAIIEDVLAGISTTSSGRPDTPLHAEDTRRLKRGSVLAPGESRDDLKEALPDRIDFRPTASGEVAITVPAGEDLFLWIVLRYRGPFTEAHETSACWRLDLATNRLVLHGGAEYNYAR